MITATPGLIVISILEGSTPSQSGTVSYSLKALDGTVVSVTGSAVAEIVLNGVHTGIYAASFTAPSLLGQYSVIWTDSTGASQDDLVVLSTLTKTSDATYAKGSGLFVVSMENAVTGMAGRLTVSVLGLDSAIKIEPSTATIVEITTGVYSAELPALSAGNYVIVWYDGTSYFADPLYVGTIPSGILV